MVKSEDELIELRLDGTEARSAESLSEPAFVEEDVNPDLICARAQCRFKMLGDGLEEALRCRMAALLTSSDQLVDKDRSIPIQEDKDTTSLQCYQ